MGLSRFGCLYQFVNSSGRKMMRGGERTFGPGKNPGVDAICELSLLLVTLSLAPRGFSDFSPKKTMKISKFRNGRRRTTMWMGYL